MQRACALQLKDPPPTDGPGTHAVYTTLGGTDLGPQQFLGPTTAGRAPARDPARPSAIFVALPRPELAETGCGADAVYAPAAPDFAVWHKEGAAATGAMDAGQPKSVGTVSRGRRGASCSPSGSASLNYVVQVLLEHWRARARLSHDRMCSFLCLQASACCPDEVDAIDVRACAGTCGRKLTNTAPPATLRLSAAPLTPSAARRVGGAVGARAFHLQKDPSDHHGLRCDISSAREDAASNGPGSHWPETYFNASKEELASLRSSGAGCLGAKPYALDAHHQV